MEHSLEMGLTTLLAEMQQLDKWQDVKEYEDRIKELRYLIYMEKVEFSEKRGRVHAAKKPY